MMWWWLVLQRLVFPGFNIQWTQRIEKEAGSKSTWLECEVEHDALFVERKQANADRSWFIASSSSITHDILVTLKPKCAVSMQQWQERAFINGARIRAELSEWVFGPVRRRLSQSGEGSQTEDKGCEGLTFSTLWGRDWAQGREGWSNCSLNFFPSTRIIAWFHLFGDFIIGHVSGLVWAPCNLKCNDILFSCQFEPRMSARY